MDPTPNVTIHVFGQLRTYCGDASELSISAATVADALEALGRQHPVLYRHLCDETGAVRPHLNVFVNSDHMRELDRTATRLAPGDVVSFLPAVSGG